MDHQVIETLIIQQAIVIIMYHIIMFKCMCYEGRTTHEIVYIFSKMLLILTIIKVYLGSTPPSTNKLLMVPVKDQFQFSLILKFFYMLIYKCKGLFHVVNLNRDIKVGSNHISWITGKFRKIAGISNSFLSPILLYNHL